MFRWPILLLAALTSLQPTPPPTDSPTYTSTGELKFPTQYREWIFLASGLDMSYNKQASTPGRNDSMFNTVFVNPSAYRAFKQTGTWPEGTQLVLENRGAESNNSINKRGKTESTNVMGLEVHVKDSAHLKGGWAFYGFDNAVSGKLIARPADCYTCHEQHAAVDTTFVQFYPTLLEIARQKHTLSTPYLDELETAKQHPER